MTMLLTPSLGALGPPWRRLVAPGALAAPMILTRAQVTSRSTALGSDGAGWAEYAADVARFHGTARRLLVAGQRTNGVRNPRAQGATAGSPGTWPTHWAVNGAPGDAIGNGQEDSIDYFDFRFTSGSGATIAAILESGVAVVPGEVWTGSFYLRLAAGTLTNISSVQVTQTYYSGAGGTGSILANNTSGPVVPSGASLGTQRFSYTSPAAPALAQSVQLRLRFIATGAYDFTARIGWPQMELGEFASAPILPAVGTPAASMRGADLVTATLASLGVGANGACTLLWSGMIPQNAPAGAPQWLLQVDDGTDLNRVLIRNDAATGLITPSRSTAGASLDGVASGTMTPGVPFRLGMTLDGAGRVGGCFNGAPVTAVTGGPTTGLTTLRIGNNATGTAPLFGEMGSFAMRPYAVPDAALPGLLSTLPL